MAADDRDLIVLARFDSEHDAHLLRLWLNQCGVPAVVAGNNQLFGPDSGFRPVIVYVRRIELEFAESALAEWRQADPVPLIAEWQCICGEFVDEGFHVCWSCGTDYDEIFLPDPGGDGTDQ